MKQKYHISKKTERDELVIKEFSDVNRRDADDVYGLTCETTYDITAIESAIEKGKAQLVSVLRTMNFYPPMVYAEKIAELVIDLFNSQGDENRELFIDDADIISKDWKKARKKDSVENEPNGPDETLDDDRVELDGLLGDDDPIENAHQDKDDANTDNDMDHI